MAHGWLRYDAKRGPIPGGSPVAPRRVGRVVVVRSRLAQRFSVWVGEDGSYWARVLQATLPTTGQQEGGLRDGTSTQAE